MADLSTNFMGLKLKNPLILGASNMVSNIDTIKQAEDAGIAAVVYRSLFEEQIQLEALQFDEELNEYANRSAEMERIFPNLQYAGPKIHLHNLSKLKEAVSIPVIASLNCIYESTWIEYAKLLEETGIDALELNFYAVPLDFFKEGVEIEDSQVHIVKKIKDTVNIPVSVKLSPFYSNPLNFIKKLDDAGVDGIVAFNRFFQPDVDLESEVFHFPWELSGNKDFNLTLRFAGLLHGNITAGITASRGIKTYEDMAKMLLAGVDTVQVVSTVYQNGLEHITNMLAELTAWMDFKGYSSIADFKGKLSKKNLHDPFAYKRAQYVEILQNSGDFIKQPMR